MALESRLTSFRPVRAAEPGKVAPVSFRRVADRVLVMGEGGGYCLLAPEDFKRFLAGAVAKDSAAWKELQANGLIRDYLDFQALSARVRSGEFLSWRGPNAHRIAVTARRPGKAGSDMTLETARAVVDWIFQSPSPVLRIELSGAPLLNWPTAAFIVRYAKARAQASAKSLRLRVDADAGLDERRLDALLEARAGLRLTFDGPAELHEALRASWGGPEHSYASHWLRLAAEKAAGEHEGLAMKPEGVCRLARRSLGQEERIIDAYRGLGLTKLALRFIDAPPSAAEPAASPEEYAAAFGKALDLLLAAEGGEGPALRETFAQSLVGRILGSRRGEAGIHRVSYGVKGEVFLADDDEESPAGLFCAGDVRTLRFNRLFESEAAQALLGASQRDWQPLCSQCAYRTCCGTHPALASRGQGSIWGRLPSNARCRLYMGALDAIFSRLRLGAPLAAWAQADD